MSQHRLDVDDLLLEPDVSDEPVLVAANVENRQLTDLVDRAERHFQLCPTAEPVLLDHPSPTAQSLVGLRVPGSEDPQCAVADNFHRASISLIEIFKRIVFTHATANSSRFLPLASSAASHVGTRPRPDQDSPVAALRYFAATGLRGFAALALAPLAAFAGFAALALRPFAALTFQQMWQVVRYQGVDYRRLKRILASFIGIPIRLLGERHFDSGEIERVDGSHKRHLS